MFLFVSGMLSITCHHCLINVASSSDSRSVTDNMTGQTEHQCMDEPGKEKMKPPCTLYCDCEDYVTSMDNDRHYLLKNYRAGTDQIYPFIPAYYVTVIPSGNRLFINGKPHIPDRSCFSPLERNCILLI